jgi:drug/metabolite transporter (DMT)-like permease
MVLQKDAYRIASSQFLDVYLVFSLGVVLAAVALALLKPRATVERIRRFAGFKPRYIALLICAEGVSFIGTVFSQRALDLSPSPSFVVAIESSVPVFVMLLSLLLAPIFGYLGREQTSKMFHQQVLGWKEKLVAIALMTTGIYCIAG